jgi:hypothetical protein
MNIITYQKDVPVMKSILGYAILLFALITLLTVNLIFGAIFMALGLHIISTEGSQINLTDKTYRTFRAAFGFRFGKWQPVPEFEYVSVFKTKESQTSTAIAASVTRTYDIILLNLFYNTNKHITFYKTNDKEDAFKVAEHFRLAFGIDILDATEREKRWLYDD